jgi:hypothetical protein
MNYSMTERNMFTSKVHDNLDVLQSKLTNWITNQGTNKILYKITQKINVIEVVNKATSEVKEKWKTWRALRMKKFRQMRMQNIWVNIWGYSSFYQIRHLRDRCKINVFFRLCTSLAKSYDMSKFKMFTQNLQNWDNYSSVCIVIYKDLPNFTF